MPIPTAEAMGEKVEALKKKLAEKGESLGAAELRALKKRIRRAQRRRAKMIEVAKKGAQKVVEAAAPAEEKPKAEAAKAEEAKTEEAPAEQAEEKPAEEKKEE